MRSVEEIVRANGAFVIFAAQPNEPHVVMSFMVENSIPFKVLLGSYKNERETSYCVPQDQFQRILDAGIVTEQESILVLGHFESSGLRKAEIVYLSNDRESEPAGYFVNVGRDKVPSLDGWTFDPMSDQFFTLQSAAELVEAGITVEE